MKPFKLFIKALFLVTLFCELSFSNFSPHIGYDTFWSEHPEVKAYEQARKLSIEYIRKAAASDSFQDQRRKDIAMGAINKLLIAKVYFSVNPLNQGCLGKTLAFVNPDIADTIFICGKIRESLQNPTEENIRGVAQDLAHEAIHLLGSTDECVATRFEYEVMKAAVGKAKPDSANYYRKLCGGFAEYNDLFFSNSTTASASLSRESRARSRK